jgi:hypothetical protein
MITIMIILVVVFLKQKIKKERKTVKIYKKNGREREEKSVSGI